MYQLREVPVSEHCIIAIRRACQNLFSLAVVGCNPNENVTLHCVVSILLVCNYGLNHQKI